jgi:ribosomal protein S12 methylthiotransferase accessory factor
VSPERVAPDAEATGVMLNPDCTVALVEGNGVLIHGERESRLLTGDLYPRLIPLLDGRRDLDAIVDVLSAEFPPAEIHYAFLKLESFGAVIGPTALGDPPRVALHCLTPEGPEPWRRELETFGVVPDESAELQLVVVSNYFDPRLEEFNRAAQQAGRPWLLWRPGPTISWLGPAFFPGRTGCWDCLRRRLERNCQLDAWAARRATPSQLHTGSRPWCQHPTTGLLVAQIGALAEVGAAAPLATSMVVVDSQTLEVRRHPAPRRPECPVCGDPTLYGARLARAIPLTRGTTPVASDGGLRVAHASKTLERWGALVDPLTGIVASLDRLDGGVPGIHVYAAGSNPAHPEASWSQLRASLRRSSGGKGMTDDQARASALGEAVERYSGWFNGDEPRIRASLRRLGEQAIHPNRCMLFSERQYRDREALQGGPWGLDRVPRPFEVDAEEEWTPVWSFSRREVRYLPTGMLYFRYPTPGDPTTAADSNGNAAGTTLEEAILQGFLELVERDATAIWWYHRIRRPAVDLATLVPEWTSLQSEYARLEREVWALDLTHDLGIPVVAAVSRRVGTQSESLVLGLGAHLDPRIAASRAVGEMHQMLVTVDEDGGESRAREGFGRWLREATLVSHPYLGPCPAVPPSRLAGPGDVPVDLADAVRWCQQRVEQLGLEFLVLDLTRPDVEIPVAKVVVPGLRHFRARYAPGRLYEVPVQLGWQDSPMAEASLNPTPFFL